MPTGAWNDPFIADTSISGGSSVTGFSVTDTAEIYVRFTNLTAGRELFIWSQNGAVTTPLTIFKLYSVPTTTDPFSSATLLQTVDMQTGQSFVAAASTVYVAGFQRPSGASAVTSGVSWNPPVTGTVVTNDLDTAATSIDVDASDTEAFDTQLSTGFVGTTTAHGFPEQQRSIYYTFTPTTSVSTTFSFTGTAPTTKTRLRVFEDGSATVLGVEGTSGTSTTAILLTGGTTYYVQIFQNLKTANQTTRAISTWSVGTLAWTTTAGGSGTSLGDPIDLVTSSGSLAVSLSSGQSKFYKLTGPTPDDYQAWLTGVTANVQALLYVGTGSSPPVKASATYSTSFTDLGTEARVATGDDWYVEVRAFGSAVTPTLHWQRSTAGSPPANDDDAAADTIDVSVDGDITGGWDNTNAFGYTTEFARTFIPDSSRSIWYKFTVATSKILTFDFTPVDPANLAIYADSTGTLKAATSGGTQGMVAEVGETYYVRISQQPPLSFAYTTGTLSWTTAATPPNDSPSTAIDLPQRLTPPYTSSDSSAPIDTYWTITAPRDGVLNLTMNTPTSSGRDWTITVTNQSNGVTVTATGTPSAEDFIRLEVAAGDPLLVHISSWEYGPVQWGVAPDDDPGIVWSDWFDSARTPGAGNEPDAGWFVDTSSLAFGNSGVGTRRMAYREEVSEEHVSWDEFLVYSGGGPEMTSTIAGLITNVKEAGTPNGYGNFFVPSGMTEQFFVFGSGTPPGFDYHQWMTKAENQYGAVQLDGVTDPEDTLPYYPALAQRATNGLNALVGSGINPFIQENDKFIYESSTRGLSPANRPYDVRGWWKILSWDVEDPFGVGINVTLTRGFVADWTTELGMTDFPSVAHTDVIAEYEGVTDATPGTDWEPFIDDTSADLVTFFSSNSNFVIGCYIKNFDDIWSYGQLVSALSGLFGTATTSAVVHVYPDMRAVFGYYYPGQYRYGYQTTPNYEIIGKLKLRMPDNTWRVLGNTEDTGGRLKLRASDGTWWKEYRSIDGAVPRHPLKLWTDGGWVIGTTMTPD